MTTKPETRIGERFRLPDPPPREMDEVTAFDHIYEIGDLANLALHFGNRETTLVTADRFIVATPEQDKSRARRPDLLIAFNVSPEDYRQSNGYISSEQGKPPDFVMEVASVTTANTDTGEKREYYASMNIPEYWRFDETGQFHGQRLAGDRLVGDYYVPIAIEEAEPGVLEGYSEVLNLKIRWERGRLLWLDPATNAPIPRLPQTIEERDQAREERNQAREERNQAQEERNQAWEELDQAREERNQERARAELAEERARQLAEELRRLRENQGNT